MIINAYVIYDSAAKMYNKPFYFHNHDVAIRAVQDLKNDPQTEIAKHPSDFSLWYLGTYDDTTAVMDTDGKLEVLCRCHELPSNPINFPVEEKEG